MLSPERKGEIAYALIKIVFREKGIGGLDKELVERNIRNASKQTGIPEGELREFSRDILGEIVKEALG